MRGALPRRDRVNPTAKGANPLPEASRQSENNEDAMYTDLALYIDGKWINGGGRKGEDVLNPATGKPLSHLPHASKADLDEALEAAKKGFALWRATSASEPAQSMRTTPHLLRPRP